MSGVVDSGREVGHSNVDATHLCHSVINFVALHISEFYLTI